MENNQHLGTLQKLLYHLYYLDDIHSEDLFSDDFSQYFRTRNTGQEIVEFIKALEWASQNPNYNFRGLYPDLKFSNQEIYEFTQKMLMQFRSSFKQADLEDLIDPKDNRTLKILIVEDSQMENGFLSIHLSDTPYQTVETGELEEASSLLSDNNFDVIIISLHSDPDDLPVLIKKIQDLDKAKGQNPTPKIIYTSDLNSEYSSLLQEEKCNTMLQLPIIPAQLLQVIGSKLRRI